ncbi:DUF1835 domain-containing protein [Kordiimonas lacus]|uniref:DUF1835 domain-containing protein n=1 Tax=Kordiimonas lacus TaxID=637679 RepID=A0A1G7DD42_9PROT|nr:DUF1835 domain-containing protein [Kordiimonas lacus]SDE49548.1 protein of unknown function [Kordiimonas lacus]
MDSDKTLHIRCGSDIQAALEGAGISGAFLDFSDPFCQGPVLDLPQEKFLESRLNFITDAYGLDPAQALKKQRLRYARLANAAAFERVVLWFEHDSYDQLILMYLLKHFGALEERPALELVCVGDYPVEPRFIGLGQLAGDDLAKLYEARVQVTDGMLKLGAEVWTALTEGTPHSLVRIAQKGTPDVPLCAPAIMRHLKELPAKSSGLSLTEELTLKILATGNEMRAGDLFKALTHEHEPLPYLGDQMYWYDLKRLRDGGALTATGNDWPEMSFLITDLGRACLEGREDWMTHVGAERYVGGIQVAPDGKIWRRQG